LKDRIQSATHGQGHQQRWISSVDGPESGTLSLLWKALKCLCYCGKIEVQPSSVQEDQWKEIKL